MMQISKSILCLWSGCAAMAAGCAYQLGVLYALRVAAPDFDPSIQEGFSLLFPTLLAFAVAGGGAILAIVGLCLSWRLNRQVFFSWLHTPLLLFVLPAALALFYWSRPT